MEKITGRWITFFLLIISLHVHASQSSVVLSIHDLNDKPIEQAMVQSRFILQVSINNFETATDISHIPGMDRFQYYFADQQSNFSMHNGRRVSQIIYRFVVRADTKGSYKVGPLVVEDMKHRKIESNVISISIGDQIISKHQGTQLEKYIITTQLEKQPVYVGEKNSLHVHFLSKKPINQSEIIWPQPENMVFTRAEKKQSINFQHANGQEYTDTEWIVDFYSIKAGLSIIEDISVRFIDQQLEDNVFGRGFLNFMGAMMGIQQEMRARPIGMQVLELPKIQGFQDVTAVGQFSTLAVSVNKNSVQQGQGIILAEDIFGDANFEMINLSPLILPEGLVLYDSQAPSVDKSRTRKHYEYIIQAQAPGEYHIDAQQFNYFDPIDHQYKSLYSNPFDIIVTESLMTQSLSDDQYQQFLLDEEDQENKEENIKKYHVLEQKYTRAYQKIMVPYFWYSLLLYFFGLIFLLMMTYRYIIQKYLFTNDTFRYYIIFFQAKRACEIAAKNHEVIALHPLFIDLFVHLKVESLGVIKEEMIERYLKKKGFSDELVAQWKIFYTKLLHVSFDRSEKKNDTLLFDEALLWLARLKEKI